MKIGYITVNRKQLCGGKATHPALSEKFPSAKIRWGISRLDFVESTWHFLIINQRAKLSTWSITDHCLGN
jgi:hypothetical protein